MQVHTLIISFTEHHSEMAHMFRIHEVPSLNWGPDTRYPEMFHGIPQSLKANARLPQIKVFVHY